MRYNITGKAANKDRGDNKRNSNREHLTTEASGVSDVKVGVANDNENYTYDKNNSNSRVD